MLSVCLGANAGELKRNTAKMQAMDKITGRVSVIEVPVGGELKFGTFSIVVRDCQTRSPEETPEDFAFVDVVDYPLKNEPVNIFKGWMLSSNPAINPVEHPIYDVWLLKCINTDFDAEKLLSENELSERDLLPSIQAEKMQITEVETLVAEDKQDSEDTDLDEQSEKNAPQIILEDITFAVSEDTGDEEPNLIIPEYQFNIGE